MLRPLKILLATSETLSQFLPLGQTITTKKPLKKQAKLKFQEGQHWFVVGKTGMGKTHLIKKIIKRKLEIQPFLNVYHLDTKKRGDFSSHDGSMIMSETAPLAFTTQGNKMVWQPLIDDLEEYSTFFLRILNAGLPAIVNIDESINMKFNERIPRGLSILLAQGRLPGIHVIGGTQEVARAPRQMLSQASHIVCFNVLNDYDERMMLKYLRLREDKSLNLKKHQFKYLRPDIDDSAIFMADVNELLPLVS